MPQRYVALRMADARALRGDYPRVRYASTDAPPPLLVGARVFLPHAQSFAGVGGLPSSRRPPVRSSSDATGLYMAVALAEDGCDAEAACGEGDKDDESSTDDVSMEDTVSLLGEEAVAARSTTSTVQTSVNDGKTGSWLVSKETMFLVSAFLVLFTSGGLILGFVCSSLKP